MVKAAVTLGLGVGYVLGARAGRERFDQLKDALAAFKETSARTAQSPKVQEARKRIMTMGRDKPPAASASAVHGYPRSSTPDGVSPQYQGY